jgi:hypothetical protein
MVFIVLEKYDADSSAELSSAFIAATQCVQLTSIAEGTLISFEYGIYSQEHNNVRTRKSLINSMELYGLEFPYSG